MLGQAFYNFTYLEWVVIWTIVKLSPDGFDSVPKGKKATAGAIRAALEKAIKAKLPPLPSSLASDLMQFHDRFQKAIDQRNALLHAHPYTAADGAQRLSYSDGYKWPPELVVEAAKIFEEVAIVGNTIFHGELTKVRP